MMFGIQVFSTDGNHLNTFLPPHMRDERQAILLKKQGRHLDLSEIIKRVSATKEGLLRLTKFDRNLGLWQTWVFDCMHHRWRKPEAVSDRIIHDGLKNYYLRQTSTDQIRLEPME